MKVLTCWLAAIVGAVIWPLLPKEKGRLKWEWADRIWGNPVDGICGDKRYREKNAKRWYIRPWPCWWWSCIRNPVNALIRRFGPNGTVEDRDFRASWWGYMERLKVDGRWYWMLHLQWPSAKHELWLGYRLLDDPRTGSKRVVGHHFENTILCVPLIRRRAWYSGV